MFIACDILIILFWLILVDHKLFFVHCNQCFDRKKISGETLSHKMFLQQHNINSCPLGENQPEDDITQC